jgi:importin subunit alpha-1
VIESGAVPRLVELLTSANPKLQHALAWALCNIASGTSDNTQHVIDHGALPILVQLLSHSNDDDVREMTVWALGNLAGNSPQARDLALKAGTLPVILTVLTESSLKTSLLREATWALSNLCRFKPPPSFHLVSPALPHLARLISWTKDEEVLVNVCCALDDLSNGPNDQVQAVIDAGAVPWVIELLDHPSPEVQMKALRTVGNLVTGNDAQTQYMLDCGRPRMSKIQAAQRRLAFVKSQLRGAPLESVTELLVFDLVELVAGRLEGGSLVLQHFLKLLESHDPAIRKHTCWAVSNITAGNSEQNQEVVDAGLIPPLVQQLSAADLGVKKEAAWAISNATDTATPEQMNYLVDQQCIRPLCDMLASQSSSTINVILRAIENILGAGAACSSDEFARLVEECDGVRKLEALLADDPPVLDADDIGVELSDLQWRAESILESHYYEEERILEQHFGILYEDAGADDYDYDDDDDGDDDDDDDDDDGDDDEDDY